jgi:phospholipid-binding lipoprotein MlaA
VPGKAPAGDETGTANPADPWESWNRKVFGFNEKLDEAVLKPVAEGYTKVVPSPIRTGIDNFMGNIGDAWSTVNLFLQGRFKAGAEQGMRVAINSVLGLGGVLDIATPGGLQKNSQDFGKTLGVWGFGTGPYVVWPVLGPSDVRDSFGLIADFQVTPSIVYKDGDKKAGITGLNVVSTRAKYLKAGDIVSDIALDKYSFFRDAYLQRRRIAPPEDDDEAVEILTPAAPASAPAEEPRAKRPADPQPDTTR